jgi:hypothetical protein
VLVVIVITMIMVHMRIVTKARSVDIQDGEQAIP